MTNSYLNCLHCGETLSIKEKQRVLAQQKESLPIWHDFCDACLEEAKCKYVNKTEDEEEQS